MNPPTGTCACGCGTPVNNKWVRGHAARGEGGYQGDTGVQPVPPPDDPWWELDSGGPHEDPGVLEPDAAETPGAAQPQPAPVAPGGPGFQPGPDPPPAHGRKQWRRETKDAAPRAAPPVRVTAGVRKDVTAKLSILLGVPGSVWQARDPLCGGTFMEELPGISAAFANFVCESRTCLTGLPGRGAVSCSCSTSSRP